MTWYDDAPGAVERQEAQEEADKKARNKLGSRFYLPLGGEATITLINPCKTAFTMHKVPKGPNPRDAVETTCLAGQKKDATGRVITCPFCTENVKAVPYVYMGTVINHTGFTADDGKHIAHYKQYLLLKRGAKTEFLIQMKAQESKYGQADNALAWSRWKIRRGTDEMSFNTGQYFTFLKRTTKTALIAALQKVGVQKENWDDFMTPLSFEEAFKPLTEDEAYAFLGLSKRIGGDSKDVPEQSVDFTKMAGNTDDFDDDNDPAMEFPPKTDTVDEGNVMPPPEEEDEF